VAKSSDKALVDAESGKPLAKYLNFYTSEGKHGEMIGSVLNENNIKFLIEFVEFASEQIDAGNKVYLNFNERQG
jgi:hypothetical protein